MNEIYQSYINGQRKQLFRQVEEMGVYDFLHQLALLEVPIEAKYGMLHYYLLVKELQDD